MPLGVTVFGVYLGHDTGAVSLDLLATLGGRRAERLVDDDALKEWLVGRELVDPVYRLEGDDLGRARALRSVLFAVVEAELSGKQPDIADVAAINEAASVPERALRLRLGPHGLCRERGRPRFDEVLGTIARDVIKLLTGPQRGLLRECAADDCRGIYLDTSPGRGRRWCSGARCGNRARVAAHRASRGRRVVSAEGV